MSAELKNWTMEKNENIFLTSKKLRIKIFYSLFYLTKKKKNARVKIQADTN